MVYKCEICDHSYNKKKNFTIHINNFDHFMTIYNQDAVDPFQFIFYMAKLVKDIDEKFDLDKFMKKAMKQDFEFLKGEIGGSLLLSKTCHSIYMNGPYKTSMMIDGVRHYFED